MRAKAETGLDLYVLFQEAWKAYAGHEAEPPKRNPAKDRRWHDMLDQALSDPHVRQGMERVLEWASEQAERRKANGKPPRRG